MGGWVGGEMEIKANLSQSLFEVEAELGKKVYLPEANGTYTLCHNCH